MQTSRAFFVPALLAVAALAACGSSDDDQPAPPVAVPVAVGDTVALSVSGSVLSFDRATPATLKGSIAVSGLQPNEKLVGLDVRPADGLLYALSYQARLYTLDASTGVATFKAALSAAAGDDNPYTALTGSQFGVDFNPVADRQRVISDSGLNLRINVDTGATTTDGAINRAGVPPVVAGGAYGNSFAGARSTVLYDLDAASAVLAQQVPPNDGTLVNVGALAVPFSGAASMDIAGGANGLVLAALRTGAAGPYTLYTVSLTTGAATLFRNTTGDATRSLIGGSAGPSVLDIAIRF